MMLIRTTALLSFLLAGAAYAAEPQEQSPAEPDQRRAEQPAPAASTQTSTSSDQQRRAAPANRSAATDRLELDTTVVTGNRELPKVLYIVPWKKAELGDLPAQPFNTLLDEALTPVDRDVFRREVTYYEAVASGADANQSTSPPQP